ncbi:MAG: LicD family protein [Adhaeribacter sp.]
MAEILDAVDSICRKHNINYYLCSGTLLGARRHGGFIPWDDDLDVIVLRKDYKRLLALLELELPERFKLQTRKTDENYWFYFAKVRDTNSRIYEKGNERFNFKYKGIFIDIFPIEPQPSYNFKVKIDFYLRYMNITNFGSYPTLWLKLKYAIKYCLQPLVHVLIFLLRFYYRNRKSNYNSYSYGIPFYTNYNLAHFTPVGEIMFEGKMYKAPNDVDGYLTIKYGKNFMEVPPEEKRIVHSTALEIY